MQLPAPQPRRHKVLISFRYWNAWDVIFFDTDRMPTALPRRARFNSDEALIKFAQRAGGIKMSEDRQILDMMIQRKTSEIEKTVSEGEDVPTQAERSAIERVQSTLKQSKAAIEVELEMKGSNVHNG
jgi:hypothetical protein